MTSPLLTIGIPTLDRHQFLGRALASCMRQTIRPHVIVADQGHLKETRWAIEQVGYPDHIEHLKTRATNLWENWEACARACDTPYFAWLQDDDIIAPSVMRKDGSLVPGTGYVERVCAAFDQFPDALHWQARLYCGCCPADGTLDDVMASWWGASGPWVYMPIIRQAPMMWPGQILVPTAYLISWSLSPAVAFRCGEQFTRALDCMPSDSDLNLERLILATMGMQGPFIADPMVAGYWIHHGGNESYKQHPRTEQQTEVMVQYLDECMDRTDWRDILTNWCQTMNPVQVTGWANNFPCPNSRHAHDIRVVMGKAVEGRIEAAEAPAHAHKAVDPGLTWTGEELHTMRGVA